MHKLASEISIRYDDGPSKQKMLRNCRFIRTTLSIYIMNCNG